MIVDKQINSGFQILSFLRSADWTDIVERFGLHASMLVDSNKNTHITSILYVEWRITMQKKKTGEGMLKRKRARVLHRCNIFFVVSVQIDPKAQSL